MPLKPKTIIQIPLHLQQLETNYTNTHNNERLPNQVVAFLLALYSFYHLRNLSSP